MALLENLIVEPALYQYDTGPEAQVGDQVKLFLDQDANPGYPEFIFGTIQHPITKVNCESATSYNIEYDADDLIVESSLLVIGDVLSGTAVIGQIQVVANELDEEIAARIAGDAAIDERIDDTIDPYLNPIQLEGVPTGSEGTIAGTLVPNATGNFYRIGDLGGYPAFASANYPSTYPYQLFTYTGLSWLLRHYIAPGVYASWISNNITLELGPDPGESTGWIPGFAVGTTAATGTPTISYNYGTEAYFAVFGDRFFLNTGSLTAPVWQEVLPAQDGAATNLNVTGGTLTAMTLVNPTSTNGTATGLTLTNPTESVVAIGNSGTAQTMALTTGTFQTITLTGNCTFTMPTATAGKSLTLKVLSGAGSFTATFTGVKWPGASAPTITATAGKFDMLQFKADGASWIGQVLGQNYTA